MRNILYEVRLWVICDQTVWVDIRKLAELGEHLMKPTRKSIQSFFALLVFAIFTAPAFAASQGHVTKRISGCDYFMVNARGGYAILEWYGGHDSDNDDLLIGSFEAYGMHDIVDDTADETLTVWTEEFGLSHERALETLVDKCSE